MDCNREEDSTSYLSGVNPAMARGCAMLGVSLRVAESFTFLSLRGAATPQLDGHNLRSRRSRDLWSYARTIQNG